MPQPTNFAGYEWINPPTIPARSYICGYCGKDVSSEKGYRIYNIHNSSGTAGGVFLCPTCKGATYFTPNFESQIPGPRFGRNVDHVPEPLTRLFSEARDCAANSDYTATVLICRKMLMNIAVSQGATEGSSFLEYVNFLAEKGFVPPNGKHWVDHIRKKGNEANHEIKLMSQKDAFELLTFVEMLLRFIFEFPNMVPKEPTKG